MLLGLLKLHHYHSKWVRFKECLDSIPSTVLQSLWWEVMNAAASEPPKLLTVPALAAETLSAAAPPHKISQMQQETRLFLQIAPADAAETP